MAQRRDLPAVRAPAHLDVTTRKWFSAVVAEYSLEPHHLKLLTLAAESWDRCVAARKAIKANGLTYADRFGAPHARPEIAIERDSRLGFARLIRELDLDVDPPTDGKRPPSLRSNRRS
jgi:phage terminase small subunit